MPESRNIIHVTRVCTTLHLISQFSVLLPAHYISNANYTLNILLQINVLTHHWRFIMSIFLINYANKKLMIVIYIQSFQVVNKVVTSCKYCLCA